MKLRRIRHVFFLGIFLLLAQHISAQPKSLAIVRADKNDSTRELAEIAERALETSFRFADPELQEQVISVATKGEEKDLFNLSLQSARNIGVGIGCDFFLILKSENLRRSSFKKDAYYEAYLAAFLVDARTGKLLAWKHLGAEADEAAQAGKALSLSFKEYLPQLPDVLKNALLDQQKNFFDASVYQINDDSGQGLRTPLPFRRISPGPTPTAQHLRIEAVVDIEVAIDSKGYVTGTRIVRWAGFGLDETVAETVRKMNFRPAILDGKAIPARFLLRYNFRVPAEPKK